MINDLQERFQFKDRDELDAHIAMKKQQALLPDINQTKQQKRKWKHNGAIAQRALGHWEEKYGKAPFDLLRMRPATREEQDEELEDLFDSVVDEIEERQEYLEKIVECGGNKEIETRTKNEIVQRIGELQKIRELQMRTQKTRTTK